MITDKDDTPLVPDAPMASNDTLFRVARAVLFKMEPERAHDIALNAANLSVVKFINRKRYATNGSALTCMGLQLPNCVGLAAGLDKNGDYIDALGAMGFGFIEIGTITPKPQKGNPQPRLFRLKKHGALINRMGFNNLGVDMPARQSMMLKMITSSAWRKYTLAPITLRSMSHHQTRKAYATCSTVTGCALCWIA